MQAIVSWSFTKRQKKFSSVQNIVVALCKALNNWPDDTLLALLNPVCLKGLLLAPLPPQVCSRLPHGVAVEAHCLAASAAVVTFSMRTAPHAAAAKWTAMIAVSAACASVTAGCDQAAAGLQPVRQQPHTPLLWHLPTGHTHSAFCTAAAHACPAIAHMPTRLQLG